MTPAFADLKGIDTIYCPDLSCGRERDWLVFEPTQAALWALAGVMLFFGEVYFLSCWRPRYSLGSRKDIRGGMTFLAISMFLRAGLTHEFGNKTAMYIASMIFNYFAGFDLSNVLIGHSYFLWNGLGTPSVTVAACTWTTNLVLFCIEFSLTIAGVYLMFHPHSDGSMWIGLKCLQAELGILLVLVVWTAIAFVICIRFMKHTSAANIALSAVIICLALLWNGFMFARTFFDLDNPARDNETLFFMLNYFPIMLGFLIIMLWGSPLQADLPKDVSDELENPNSDEFDEAVQSTGVAQHGIVHIEHPKSYEYAMNRRGATYATKEIA